MSVSGIESSEMVSIRKREFAVTSFTVTRYSDDPETAGQSKVKVVSSIGVAVKEAGAGRSQQQFFGLHEKCRQQQPIKRVASSINKDFFFMCFRLFTMMNKVMDG